MNTLNDIEDYLEEMRLKELKLELILERKRIAMRKYFNTEKGKTALKKANKTYYDKNYKPTGNPVGRPKNITKE